MHMKRRIITLFLALLLFGLTVFAAPQGVSTEYFEFDPSRLDVGSMYHYVASDLTGKYPMDTYVYVKSLDTIAIYKDYPQIAPDQGLVFIVEDEFNWDYMMTERVYAYNPLNDLTIPNQEIESLGQIDFVRKVFDIKATANDGRGKPVTKTFILNFEREPFYDYSLFHIDLQFALRHLKDGVKKLMVGNTFAARYNEMIIEYVGEETINGIPCRKYEHRSQGILAKLLGARGYIWLAKDDPRHYTVKYTSQLRRNATWKNFCLQLKEIRKIKPEEWEAFVQELVAEANRFFGMD